MEGTNGELTQIKTHPYDRELARIKNFLKGSAKGYTLTSCAFPELSSSRSSDQQKYTP